MEKQEAKQIIQQALSTVKATIQEHNLIQQAFMVLTREEEVKEDDKETK